MQVLVRRRGYTLFEFLVVLGIASILGVLFFPHHPGARQSALRVSCQSNPKQIGLAHLQYAQDYDEKLVPIAPNALSGVAPFARPYGWADAIQPYFKSTQLLQCPSEATNLAGTDATQSGFTDYWMNLHLSRAQMKNLTNPSQTILCGDGNDGSDETDARYSLRALPRAWLSDKNSPAWRHLDTTSILFADGHVKSLKADRIVSGTPRAGAATFALN